MQDAAPSNLFLRNDTMFGVCEGIGTDFGFNPNWLRLVFAGAFYWFPVAVIGVYLALGVVVAATRLLCPDLRAAPAAVVDDAAVEADSREDPLPLAA
jgi:phage shock protein PspC (stress-responsive transcriptional regulator)